ncbi:MAG: HEPN domain-containing protein [Syntrophobacterales bacterium]|nr:MAG: HEPN domain-containing protein [Syntrophobacterales bacterium]
MNNREKGKALILTAERVIKRDLGGAVKDGDFNMVVRRAQEAVELVLKGALTVLGIEYPKIHDVGKVFADVVQRKVGTMESEILEKIIHISTRLSENRAPAFYGERSYGEGEAKEAHCDALFVLDKVKDLLKESMG